MSKFLGFLLGVVVALAGPAVFGVLAAAGGIELNAKEMALAYGIGALIFWTVVSYFSGAAALGAALTFGAMIYAVHWIPNRTTNFLNGVPGVTTGMIDGIKQYTLNGVVPILAVISLVYAIQSIVRAVQRRRRERAEAERLQREQEAAQAQQAAEVAAAYPVAGAGYPVAGGDYPTSVDNRFGSNAGNTSYDDLFDEDPTPFPPRNPADDQTTQFANADADPEFDGYDEYDDRRAEADDETVLVPTDRDETVQVPSDNEAADQVADQGSDEADGGADGHNAVNEADEMAVQEPKQQAADQTVAEGTERADDETQINPPPAFAAPTSSTPAGASPAAGTPASPAGTPPAAGTSAAPAGPSPAGDTPATPEPSNAIPAAPVPASPAASGDAPVSSTPSDSASTASTGSAAPKEAAGPNAATPPAGSKPAGQGAEVRSQPEPGRNEEVGQQYRERMDGPDVDDSGEHFFGAFENPNLPEEGRPQAPRVMDFPSQFRPAGA
ncbi:MAG: hypothetical protein QOF10_3802 [Kribbellaceae bacterium]|nr:hypothetical protein [Kribbellaceae bacterium]